MISQYSLLLSKIRRFVRRHGYAGFYRLLLAPVTVILTTPYRMLELLWSCRVLIHGPWSDYSRFSGIASANCFFYWNQAFQFAQHGRFGVSTTIGLGNYPLAKWFHLSMPAQYIFWKMSNVTTLVCFFGWALSHALWSQYAQVGYVVTVIVLVSLSSLLYSCIDRVNYNCLGWLFFPATLYGLYIDNIWIAALSGLMASVASITVAFFILISSAIFALHSLTITPLVAMIPLGLKVMVSGFIAVSSDPKTVRDTLSIIGLNRKAVKYSRNIKLTITNLYFLTLFGTHIGLAFYLADVQNLIFIYIASALTFLYLLNETGLLRFADTHSLYLAIWSVLTANTIIFENFILLVSFLFVSNPIPYFGLFFDDKKIIDVVPIRKPVCVKKYLESAVGLLEKVPSGSKVIFSFKDPSLNYDKIFDGYREIYEVLLYAAAVRGINIFPDWYAVADNNHSDAHQFWGRDITSVLTAAHQWNAAYVVVYDADNDLASPEFHRSEEFICVGTMDWASIAAELSPGCPYGGVDQPPSPVWQIFEIRPSLTKKGIDVVGMP